MSLDWSLKTFQTHVGSRQLFRATLGDYELIDVEPLFPDINKNWKRSFSELTGFAWHHDAVVYTGTTVAQETQRLQAIYNYHIQQGWNGIGYHAVQGNSNRIYIPRRDVLDTHRAHVATGATDQRVNPPSGTPVWNRQLIGYCMMGDYTQQGTPPLIMRQGANAFFRYVTNTVGREMSLRPHKYYQNKACPGTWASVNSWADIVYTPEIVDRYTEGYDDGYAAGYSKGLSDGKITQAQKDAIVDTMTTLYNQIEGL